MQTFVEDMGRVISWQRYRKIRYAIPSPTPPCEVSTLANQEGRSCLRPPFAQPTQGNLHEVGAFGPCAAR